jgi:hypothetical protein
MKRTRQENPCNMPLWMWWAKMSMRIKTPSMLDAKKIKWKNK